MMILTVLNVDKEKLAETSLGFEEGMGRLAQFGITLSSYTEAEKYDAYEYAAFIWNSEKQEYVQTGRAVMTEQLCRNRFREYVDKCLLVPCFDSGNVVFKRRHVSEFYGGWENFE